MAETTVRAKVLRRSDVWSEGERSLVGEGDAAEGMLAEGTGELAGGLLMVDE